MPRRPRIFIDGAIYHVYCRFGHGARVFAQADEADRFLSILRDVARTDGLTILAWCLMPTHYHLAVRTGSRPLWKSLRLIQGRFAVSYTRRHHTLGALWQGRYKARLVTGTDSLRRLLAYIHINPVKAGLVARPAEYARSGHRELLGRVREGLIDVRETLTLFGDRVEQARREYAAIVRAVGREAWAVEQPGRLPWWARVDGSDDALPSDAARPRLDALGMSTAPVRLDLAVGEVVTAVCGELPIDEELVASDRQDRATVRARELLAVLAIERCGVRVGELARRLGKPADTVSRWVTRGIRRRAEDAVFETRLKQIEAVLRGRSHDGA